MTPFDTGTGFHLGTGLYFGFDGARHGQWRGALHVWRRASGQRQSPQQLHEHERA